MKEIWKDIEGYEGKYQVSNFGRVKNMMTGRELKPSLFGGGYSMVNLHKNNKRYYKFVHRLVAQTFMQNPDNLPYVNHKDENKLNNNVNNLEWCTQEYNINYGTRNKRTSIKLTNHPNISKQVLCVETGVVYPSTREVERQLGIGNAQISEACRGKLKTVHGFHWQYIT